MPFRIHLVFLTQRMHNCSVVPDRWWLQNQGMELQDTPMPIHSPWPPWLHSHCAIPRWVPLDCQCKWWPDNPHLELAITQLYLCPDWPQSLCHVRLLSPQGGFGCLSLPWPDCSCLGHWGSKKEDRVTGWWYSQAHPDELRSVWRSWCSCEVCSGGAWSGSKLGFLPSFIAFDCFRCWWSSS